MQLPESVEIRGIRVLTTKQIAKAYGTDTDILKNNFTYNRKRFVEGKHFISIAGDVYKRQRQSTPKEGGAFSAGTKNLGIGDMAREARIIK